MIDIPPRTPSIPLPMGRDRSPPAASGADFLGYLKAQPAPEQVGDAEPSPTSPHETPLPAARFPLEKPALRGNWDDPAGARPGFQPTSTGEGIDLFDGRNAASCFPTYARGTTAFAQIGVPQATPGLTLPTAVHHSTAGQAGIGLIAPANADPVAMTICLQPESTEPDGLLGWEISQVGIAPNPSSGDEGCDFRPVIDPEVAMPHEQELPALSPADLVPAGIEPPLPSKQTPESEVVESGATVIENFEQSNDATPFASEDTFASNVSSDDASVLSPGAVRLQAQSGQEKQDWIIRPWRLQANAGLSYRGSQTSAGGGQHESAPVLTGASPGAARMPDGASVNQLGNSQGLASWKDILNGPLRIEPVRSPAEAIGGDPTDPAGLAGRSPAAGIQWPQRMLRWNAGATDGEGVTAWVRDFGLDASDVPQLLSSLRALSAEQGLQLARIMINGHAAWTANGDLT